MTIKESLYLQYGDHRSSDFKLMMGHVDSGLYEETFLSDRQIREIKVKGSDKPLFQDIEREPLTIPVNLIFEEPWNDDLIDRIAIWLNQDFYQPLSFSSNPHKVYYALCVDSIDIIHAGLKEGYLKLSFRCDSPYAYSHVKQSNIHVSGGSNAFEIFNRGHMICKPLIYIKKTISDGNVRIINNSHNQQELVLNNLKLNEEVLIDCENEEIESNLPLTYRFDDHNDVFIEWAIGVNRIQMIGRFEMYFKYQFKYIS